MYRRIPMPKCDFNKVALLGKTTLLKSHFGMGRTPFPKKPLEDCFL